MKFLSKTDLLTVLGVIVGTLWLWNYAIEWAKKIPLLRPWIDKVYRWVVKSDQLIDRIIEENGKELEEAYQVGAILEKVNDIIGRIRREFEQAGYSPDQWEEIKDDVLEKAATKINESKWKAVVDPKDLKWCDRKCSKK